MQRIVYGVLKRVGSFRFRAPAEDFDVSTGDYVLIHSTKMRFLGQVEETRDEFVLAEFTRDVTRSASSFPGSGTLSERDTTMVPKSQVEASGRVLCAFDAPEGVSAVALDFDVADHVGAVAIEMAPDKVVHSYVAEAFRTEGPMLRVGALLGVSESVPIRLDPAGFKRPTGLFGQTGAGKSYALGVIVEELILQTKVNVVVLDPNGDFVRFKDDLRELGDINDGGNRCSLTQKELDAYHKVHDDKINRVSVFSADASVQGGGRRFLRLSDLDQREIAAALGLDRVAHPEEYHLLQWGRDELERLGGEGGPSYGVEALASWIDGAPMYSLPMTPCAERLGRALRNSHLESLRIWGSGSGDESTLVSLLRDDEVQVVIIDMSTLERLERALVASVVFRTLFEIQEDHRRKTDGKCTVLVLDEAHHLFPQRALFPEQQLTVDWGTTIAGEGRKYGLYLVVASQLPSKVHEHVLTQCGNLVLMKMASQSDIDALRDSFSFVPGSLLERSKWFEKGEALVIGDIVPAPSCLLHFEGRKTQEGGRDLKVDWGEDLRLGEG